jgi:hypothetical protein
LLGAQPSRGLLARQSTVWEFGTASGETLSLRVDGTRFVLQFGADQATRYLAPTPWLATHNVLVRCSRGRTLCTLTSYASRRNLRALRHLRYLRALHHRCPPGHLRALRRRCRLRHLRALLSVQYNAHNGGLPAWCARQNNKCLAFNTALWILAIETSTAALEYGSFDAALFAAVNAGATRDVVLLLRWWRLRAWRLGAWRRCRARRWRWRRRARRWRGRQWRRRARTMAGRSLQQFAIPAAVQA